ncbi:hypothetical protein [Alicyclobacillus hesperidum]|uniref:hypothetical protein n=1 Tax=Alicyclobacillus hesperidum TaxID=89784 RepID=UPI0007190C02|nr:hypothetical protein [Alicyclobacillus hesperidum]KRW92459.1 hypothetical protein SD51_02825 [Alicyclobacillus tengchongensis]
MPDVFVSIRIVVARPPVVDLAGFHRFDEPATCHLAIVVHSQFQSGTLNAVREAIVQRHIHSLQQVLCTAKLGKRVAYNLALTSVNHSYSYVGNSSHGFWIHCLTRASLSTEGLFGFGAGGFSNL